MIKHLVLLMLAILGLIMSLSFLAATSTLAQIYPHSEEYMQQYDGGDRAEYLQEMEHSDPQFYVPPVNDASLSTTNNSIPAN